MKKKLKIPKRITPDPILESVVELRFNTSLPTDAIFGLVYSKLITLFPDYEALPILQLPEAIRNHDTTLQFAPHYKFKNIQYQINVGPKVFAIINQKPYAGWDDFFSLINKVIKEISTLNFITNVTRIGVRYIDFFENINIYDHLEFKIQDFPFSTDQSSFTTTFECDGFRTNLQVSNSDKLLVNGKQYNGSIFDSDTYIDSNIPFTLSNVLEKVSLAHDIEKKIFYTLIKDEFINSLNPEFE